MTVLRPTTSAELEAIVASAGDARRRLALRGGRTKDGIGLSETDAEIVDMTGFAGVIDYDPAELMLTAGAGTPLAEIERLVADENQMLAFDPFDHGPIFGCPAGSATIGGIIAAGVGGSRRLSAGGVRDHLLGFTAVSGRGERFVAGGKVVKNVTGYDLSKLVCGSWGRLAALTEVTLKVLPRPRTTATFALRGQMPADAVVTMARAMGSQANVAAAAYLPGGITALRIEGFDHSVTARLALLARLLPGGESMPDAEADALWNMLRTVSPLAGGGPLWRIAIGSRDCADLIARLGAGSADYLVDWAGGLVWLAHEGPAEQVREAARLAGGHAMLVRRGALADTPPLDAQPPAIAALETRVRRAFDPLGVFETGRFGQS
ncbi:MAG: glycolate oxidase subunit GlcE [Sphingobium sp.]